MGKKGMGGGEEGKLYGIRIKEDRTDNRKGTRK